LLERLESQRVLGVCDAHSATDLLGLPCGIAVVSREKEGKHERKRKRKRKMKRIRGRFARYPGKSSLTRIFSTAKWVTLHTC